jgi:hypothetical protein
VFGGYGGGGSGGDDDDDDDDDDDGNHDSVIAGRILDKQNLYALCYKYLSRKVSINVNYGYSSTSYCGYSSHHP